MMSDKCVELRCRNKAGMTYLGKRICEFCFEKKYCKED